MKQQSVCRHLLSNNDDLLHRIKRFYIKMEEGAKGQGRGETERERGRECECRTRRNTASVVKWNIRE